jgi:hypothetical protein
VARVGQDQVGSSAHVLLPQKPPETPLITIEAWRLHSV